MAPGLIDMWAFIGEPGAEHRETIETATLAAAAGGVTTIVARLPAQPRPKPVSMDALENVLGSR